MCLEREKKWYKNHGNTRTKNVKKVFPKVCFITLNAILHGTHTLAHSYGAHKNIVIAIIYSYKTELNGHWLLKFSLSLSLSQRSHIYAFLFCRSFQVFHWALLLMTPLPQMLTMDVVEMVWFWVGFWYDLFTCWNTNYERMWYDEIELVACIWVDR